MRGRWMEGGIGRREGGCNEEMEGKGDRCWVMIDQSCSEGGRKRRRKRRREGREGGREEGRRERKHERERETGSNHTQLSKKRNHTIRHSMTQQNNRTISYSILHNSIYFILQIFNLF